MYLKYGNYTHENCEAMLAIETRSSLTSGGVPYMATTRWSVSGMLVGSNVADLTTKIQAMEAAYKIRGVDAVLLDTDGTTRTAHKMLHADTLGGVRVIGPPSFPDGADAEYTTYRHYTIVLEADFAINPGDPATQILEWQESLEMFGGGSLLKYTEPIDGTPVRQVVRTRITYKAMQSGAAVGFQGYPKIPPPIFPGALMENPRIVLANPRRNGYGLQEYPVTWTYIFESPLPLSGRPNPQPV